MQLHAKEQLARLERNAVITDMDMVADDVDILAALGVDAVRVGALGAVADADIQDVYILGVSRVNRPGVAVAGQHAVQHNILGAACKEKTGPPCDLLLLRVLVPVAVLGVAIQRSLAGDRHILRVDHIDERGKAVKGVALPQGQILLVLLVMAGENARQDRVVMTVGAAEQRAALFKIQGRIALQKEALGAVGACGQIDRTAGRAGGKRRL